MDGLIVKEPYHNVRKSQFELSRFEFDGKQFHVHNYLVKIEVHKSKITSH